jgi:hypothetical protein
MNPLEYSELEARFQSYRPGAKLVKIEPAALPVVRIGVTVVAQEKNQVPLLNEFVIRCVQAGLSNADDIRTVLGMPLGPVQETIVELVHDRYLWLSPADSSLQLTESGTELSRDFLKNQPVEQEIDLSFDRFSWRIADYGKHDLITKREAREMGRVIIEPVEKRSLKSEDVLPRDIDQLEHFSREMTNQIDILGVTAIRPRKYLYMPTELLIFVNQESDEVEIIPYVNFDLSPFHQQIASSQGLLEKLKISFSKQRETEEILIEVPQVPDNSAIPVREIDTFEHNKILEDALLSSAKRLLIISPWITRAVVNTTFLSRLERLLRRNVIVHIGFGYGKESEDTRSDKRSIQSLANLSNRFQNLTFTRLKNTHSKILVCDDMVVTTSFNWLSFAGDPDRTYRMETGTEVKNADYANGVHGDKIKLFEDFRS